MFGSNSFISDLNSPSLWLPLMPHVAVRSIPEVLYTASASVHEETVFLVVRAMTPVESIMPLDSPAPAVTTAEHQRLTEISDDASGWRRWGPYVSDRAWATVREDYSENGTAWDYLPHEHARSKSYRWGEDGIAGLCDRYQLMIFAPAFWNTRDRMLKERLFGVSGSQGNHGEDVKEYYFHIDNTPTHSYMQLVYKYPQGEYPYEQLVEENRRRGGQGFEYELLDTGLFNEDRYFDIVIEYAKADAEDICIRISAHNRGPEAAPLHILPHLWFRNTWGWKREPLPEPNIMAGPVAPGYMSLRADYETKARPSTIPETYDLGTRMLYASPGGNVLITNNETNAEVVYGPGNISRKSNVKDAFHRYVCNGEDCLIHDQKGSPASGTKAALHYVFPAVPAQGSVVLKLRLTPQATLSQPLDDVDRIIALRKTEADEFYAAIQPPTASEDIKRVQRQAFAGLLWTKQCYIFDVNRWFDGDNPDCPPSKQRLKGRNKHWRHLNSVRVLSMPDKWEYPWFAAWDLAFQTVAFCKVDPAFAKDQLWYMLFEQFQHPNGQIPAYEWEFSDLNPPVHAWAVWRVYNMDRRITGKPDLNFLERCFHKLLINFAWWVNRVDREGNNLFEGGFLGLDNISVFDRSVELPGGAKLDQADATGWMGMYCLNLMRISLELAEKRGADQGEVYEGLAFKFFQHYTNIAAAMKRMGLCGYQLYDETDGFFYDVLRYPDGRFHKVAVRSLVGLIPLFAVERLDKKWIERFPSFYRNFQWYRKHRSNFTDGTVHDLDHTYLLTIVDQHQLEGVMKRVWDEKEFLSPYGLRSLSKVHEKNPYRFDDHNLVEYEPAEAHCKIKGGNSNWRGPIWMPTNFLLIESLRKLGKAYGETFKIRTPASNDRPLSFQEMAREGAQRLIKIFTRDEATGGRPVYGPNDGVAAKFQNDPHWKDYILFFEYFHGDNGAGLGASHQTGWTALVASLIDEWN